MKRITDRNFIYVPAERTDIRKTFQKVREQQQVEAEREKQEAAWRLKNAIELKRRTK